MNNKLTNAHMHIFVSECAPPSFFKVLPFKPIKYVAQPFKKLLEKDSVRRFVWRMNKRMKFYTRYRTFKLNRVISFLNVGAQRSQLDVFKMSLKVAKNYHANPRLVALTLDMDYMDNACKPIVPFETQLYDVLEIKRFYPDNIFPFIGVDPRTRSGEQLVEWIRFFFEHGVISESEGKVIPYGSGIKLYPAHGFFPFDPALSGLYEYAQKKGIPVMFHCTRVGSQYIGNEIEVLIPDEPEMMMPKKDPDKKADNARKEIIARIKRYRTKDWIKNSDIGKNEYACDLFSHPQNYIPVLCKYPRLKICLAHMGGNEEVEYMDLFKEACMDEDRRKKEKFTSVKRMKTTKKIWKEDGCNWAALIKEMMLEYKNLYTDISSTVTHLDDKNGLVLKNIKEWIEHKDDKNESDVGPLRDRILFGTDFFMTEMSKKESRLYSMMQRELGEFYPKMRQENIDRFLYGKA